LLPPQCFSHSRGFTPTTICWPYFMPVPSLGFYPSGPISTHRASRSFERFYPLVVCFLCRHCFGSSLVMRFLGQNLIIIVEPLQNSAPFRLHHFRVLFPVSVRFFHNDELIPSGSSRPSWLHLLRVFLLPAGEYSLGTRPLMSFSA
jgi:hypothetical protein